MAKAFNAFEICRYHQTGYDWTINLSISALVYEAVVVVVVIKELSGDEVSTCVYFFLKVLDIVCLRWGFGVFFRIATDSDLKVGKL